MLLVLQSGSKSLNCGLPRAHELGAGRHFGKHTDFVSIYRLRLCGEHWCFATSQLFWEAYSCVHCLAADKQEGTGQPSQLHIC